MQLTVLRCPVLDTEESQITEALEEVQTSEAVPA